MRTVAVFPNNASIGKSHLSLVIVAYELSGLYRAVCIVFKVVLLTAHIGNLAVFELAREAVGVIASTLFVGIAYHEAVAVAVFYDVHDCARTVAVIEPACGELGNGGFLDVVGTRGALREVGLLYIVFA